MLPVAVSRSSSDDKLCNSGFVDDVMFSHKVRGVGNIGVGVVLKQSKFPMYSLFDFVIVCGSKQ